jgi:hypothetical protein
MLADGAKLATLREADIDRKDTHWGPRKLKRDGFDGTPADHRSARPMTAINSVIFLR